MLTKLESLLLAKEALKKERIQNNSYVKFGKFLLQHLKLMDDPDKLDWLAIIEQFSPLTTDRKPGLVYINWVVCHEFKQDPSEVRNNKTRKHKLVHPRHVAIYLAILLFRYTHEELCEFYHMQNRSNMSASVANVKKLLYSDKFFKTSVEDITEVLIGTKKHLIK